MRRSAAIARATALLLAAGAASCSSGDAPVPIGTVTAEIAIGASVRSLTVNNTAGSVRLSPSRDDRVTVRADVSVRASLKERYPAADLARDLDAKLTGDVVAIASRHVGADGSDWELHLVIEAPPRLHWSIVQAAGELHVTGADTDVAASVAAGAVAVDGRVRHLEIVATAGEARADLESLGGGSIHASAGDVRLALHGAGPTDSLALTASMGTVDVELPASVSAEVELNASLGSIELHDAAGVTSRQEALGRRATGTLGRGGPAITATAAVGGIRFSLKR